MGLDYSFSWRQKVPSERSTIKLYVAAKLEVVKLALPRSTKYIVFNLYSKWLYKSVKFELDLGSRVVCTYLLFVCYKKHTTSILNWQA